ncbi:MAG TPA: DUF2480 family protein [Candidatus Marinimicrobia bacterium]|nr:DUF2480 family protein [Candidatus Neomarinimicrobiota bacterium]
MTTISMDDFLDGGILKEKSFRKQVAEIDWSQYKGDRVLVRGCSEVPVPTWAYLILTAQLAQFVDRIYFGELRSAVKIFVRDLD